MLNAVITIMPASTNNLATSPILRMFSFLPSPFKNIVENRVDVEKEVLKHLAINQPTIKKINHFIF